MLNIVLYQPEIPPNTGNIIRLCANTGCNLHLVKPLGFDLDDKKLRRAGLDYREFASVQVHEDLAALQHLLPNARLLAVSTRGTTAYHEHAYCPGDAIILGPETRGLPTDLLQALPPEQVLRIPMRPGSRSLNLSNAAALICYEGLRQLGFPGLE
ncbi:tRNA (uridine(34)/cytosine(34)/5-carboxymethylaminomethyluridine(34)-2'-O)-methyltransferase TrmL [Kineobactrum sediminis]|uniref:tRNA (cytidine(34)-2'-O)-methyltransferase n=1 Tax=Kineobactrum sediminis TaxID=1905677 RepID=A0A2N5Y7B0_9GAMM|nr:tRNA (cytidine(34)-2'-O)-methyltransferase [Kineobactrum sediminis]PLW84278.1 tRNA (uridine(34)/cytosine(34)/5-carboxymethylaminomethyluridine(34)-2'-O)-methyltransferase TrmL [Kineobactrum sediminis]